MHIVNPAPAHDTYFSMLARRSLVRRVMATVLVAMALMVSGLGTAFAIQELSDADADVEGY